MDEHDYVGMMPSCCCVPFKMSKILYDNRWEDGKTWYCPACGEGRHFTYKEKIEHRLSRIESARSSEAESNKILRRQLAAQRGATTRMKNKIKQLEKEK